MHFHDEMKKNEMNEWNDWWRAEEGICGKYTDKKYCKTNNCHTTISFYSTDLFYQSAIFMHSLKIIFTRDTYIQGGIRQNLSYETAVDDYLYFSHFP